MAPQNPSIIRRLFGFISNFFRVIRTLIGIVFTGFLIIVIAGMFANQLPPMPEKGALYLAPRLPACRQPYFVQVKRRASPACKNFV